MELSPCDSCKYADVPPNEGLCATCNGHNNYESKPAPEMVNHPKHYNMGSIEPIDVIEDWKLNFNLGSTVKYIARCDYKEKPIEDLEKAAWYLNREIERREKDAGNQQR